MKRYRLLSLEWCVQRQKGPVTPFANPWCLQQKEQLWQLRACRVPALLVSCSALLSSGLQLLCHDTCSRILLGAFSGGTWGLSRVWQLFSLVTKCASVVNPSARVLLWSHLKGETMPACWSQERRGRCVHFRSFCWPFVSQVLGFGENQDGEWDLEFCEMRVHIGFNVLAIASVVEEIHNIYYSVGVSRAVLCLQIPHCSRWDKQWQKKRSLLLIEKLLWKLNVGAESHSHTTERVDWLLRSSERIESWL